MADPRNIDLAKFATVWLRQKPGTDIAWINGMMNVIISEGLHDEEFIAERTENFEALKETVKKYTPEYVEKITGIPADDLMKAARLYATSGASSILYAMGITQHITGTDNVKSLANLAMLTGNIGRPGTGVNPLRGQNNVQGACDMGVPAGQRLPGLQAGGRRRAERKFEEAWGVMLARQARPHHPQDDRRRRREVRSRRSVLMGENPMMSDPDTEPRGEGA